MRIPGKLAEQTERHISWIFDQSPEVSLISQHTRGTHPDFLSQQVVSYHPWSSPITQDGASHVGFLRCVMFFGEHRPHEVTDIALTMAAARKLHDVLETGPLSERSSQPQDFATHDDLRRWGESLYYACMEDNLELQRDLLNEFGEAFGLYQPPPDPERPLLNSEKKSPDNSQAISSEFSDGLREVFREFSVFPRSDGVAHETYRVLVNETGDLFRETTVIQKINRIYSGDFPGNGGE
jgi:hypothetical protein